MRHARARSIALVLTLALSASVVALAEDRPSSDPDTKVLHFQLAKSGKDKDKKDFTVTGDVSGLYPGAVKDLILEVTNPNNFAITVTDLNVAVADATNDCLASEIAVEDFTSMDPVPENGSASTTLDVTMSPLADEACKTVTWRLTYSGTAVKA